MKLCDIVKFNADRHIRQGKLYANACATAVHTCHGCSDDVVWQNRTFLVMTLCGGV